MYISNACVFPSDWTTENLMRTHNSRPYNPDLANTFFRAGYRVIPRIVIDFNAIPGIAELALELSYKTKKKLINDNLFAGLVGNYDAVVQAKTKTAEQSVTVKIGTKTINKKTYTMKKGSSKKVRIVVTPKKPKVKAIYRSSKKSVVSVSKTGVLKAKKAGTAKISINVSRKGNVQKKFWFKVKVVNQTDSDKKEEIPLPV